MCTQDACYGQDKIDKGSIRPQNVSCNLPRNRKLSVVEKMFGGNATVGEVSIVF